MPESVLTRRPPRAVLENYFLQQALGFGRTRIQRCLSFVSLALFDRLLSRVDYVLPRDHGLLHYLSPGVGFFQSKMDLLAMGLSVFTLILYEMLVLSGVIPP